ncbi:J domain-containing protein [Chloroflexota bacterium]
MFNLLVKHLFLREPVVAKYLEDWKDYYEILRVSPNSEAETITSAYKRIVHLYRNVLSDSTKESPLFSGMMTDTKEAHRVLSDPITRTEYDRIFWAKYNLQNTGIEEPIKDETLDALVLVAQEVSKWKRRTYWRIQRWDKVTKRAILAAVLALVLMFSGGTSFAFAKPEHPLATPFKGIAVTLTKASIGTIGLIDDVRGITATYERKIVSTALQSMRVEEGLKRIPSVTASTNDMASFPSREHGLFPDYIEKRFSQFKYTVDNGGSVSLDTSRATTDAFLEKVNQLFEQLE